MTINEAVASADALVPNSVSAADKSDWLVTLDARVYTEILSRHKVTLDAEKLAFLTFIEEKTNAIIERLTGDAPEAETPDADTQLLMDSPYDEGYIHYLLMKLFFFSGEYARYENELSVFSDIFSRYGDFINRTYEPQGVSVLKTEV